ncbi:MAG: ABC transporter permease [Spirochaetes bacterium]|nr:MAG: ABC transporter permease [Spirochaetota bacterium]
MEKLILRYFNLLRTAIAITIGVILSIIIIYIVSREPTFSLKAFLLGPFQNTTTIGNIIETASPIIFCGIAIAMSFQAMQFNIGAEGAFFISAAVGTAFAVSTQMPSFLHIVTILLISAITGALWGYIPGFLKAKFMASEIVSTLMLNYVAYYSGLYLINYHFRDKKAGFMVSHRLAESAWLRQFIAGTRIHWGIILALAFALITYYLLYHTTLGYEIRTTGSNQNFARFGGINVFKVIIISQMLTGLIAGFGGMTEVMGIHRRFTWQLSPGYGWDGVIVALIGKNHPIYIVFASLFLSYLRVGGQQLKLLSDVPPELVLVIQAIIILLITAEAFLRNVKNRIAIRKAGYSKEAGIEHDS